jgi:amino acid permease
MLYTGLLVIKAMIGEGILNLPLIIKTFGIIGGIIMTAFLGYIAISVASYLGKCKQITQRYSYAIYSKLMMGATGTIIMKISLIVMVSTMAVVQLIVFGDVLKGLSILVYDVNVKILIIGIALVLLPFMFQKDISGIAKIAYFGIIGLAVFYICQVILFINKYNQGKIIYDNTMLYPKGSFKQIILCIGGYYNAFTFHMSYFGFYLPLKPRNNKTMMKSVTIGAVSTSIIYFSYGALLYLMYGDQITDSALKYLQTDLANAYNNKEMFTTILLIICFLGYMINASISSMLNVYFFKSHFIGLIKFILKKRLEKQKAEEDKKGIPLDDIEENKEADDDKQLIINEKKEELLSSRQEFLITFGCYCYVLAMAVGFDKIIILDSFNGSTVANYINIIAPCMFYLYFAKDKKACGDKTIAGFNVLFGSWLIIFYFITLFY